MAKYRPIYLGIWKDPNFERFTPNQKLLFMYFCTNSETTESGIYPLTLKTISNETGLPLSKVKKILSEGLKNICYDFDNSCIFVKNFYRYKGKGRPKLIKISIENNVKNTKTKLWLEFAKTYPEIWKDLEVSGKPLESLEKPLEKVSINNTLTPTLTNTLTNNIAKNKDKEQEPSKKGVTKEIKETKQKKEIALIFDYWNKKEIIKHKKLDQATMSSINAKLKDYSIDEIKDAINIYSVILKDDDYRWSYYWILKDFMQKGFEKFKDKDIAYENYLIKKG